MPFFSIKDGSMRHFGKKREVHIMNI